MAVEDINLLFLCSLNFFNVVVFPTYSFEMAIMLVYMRERSTVRQTDRQTKALKIAKQKKQNKQTKKNLLLYKTEKLHHY